ncbi:MAG: hypothetical protein ACRYGR_08670 [Janthinobacterium lividum]
MSALRTTGHARSPDWLSSGLTVPVGTKIRLIGFPTRSNRKSQWKKFLGQVFETVSTNADGSACVKIDGGAAYSTEWAHFEVVVVDEKENKVSESKGLGGKAAWTALAKTIQEALNEREQLSYAEAIKTRTIKPDGLSPRPLYRGANIIWQQVRAQRGGGLVLGCQVGAITTRDDASSRGLMFEASVERVIEMIGEPAFNTMFHNLMGMAYVDACASIGARVEVKVIDAPEDPVAVPEPVFTPANWGMFG